MFLREAPQLFTWVMAHIELSARSNLSQESAKVTARTIVLTTIH
jgi:hypothetical protein